MKTRVTVGIIGLLIVALVVGDAMARGRGGGGRGGGGRGGGGRSMGGGGRSMGGRSAPSMSRSPSYNRGGGQRGGYGGGSGRQPSARSRQQPSRGQAGNRVGQQPGRGQAGNRVGQQPGRGQPGNRTGQNFFGQGQAGNRVGQQPGRGQAGNRLGSGPQGRPSQGDLNRFLNISPGTGAAVAGGAAAGARVGNRDARPGVGNRDARPGAGNRGPAGDRRGQAANRRQNRPSQLPANRAARVSHRHNRGNAVRRHIPAHLPAHGHGFWRNHPHYARWRVNRPYRWAAWGALTGWFAWGSVGGQYYDYGSGGNCYSEDGTVYYEDEPIATEEEFAEQAIGFADVGAQTIDEAIAADADIEWMPLGVFALVHESEGEPTMYMQLAISQDGTISGTYLNTVSNSSQTIQGSVDKESQRAAWTVGDKSQTVVETSLYNLTKDEAPALLHFGTEKTQEWLLVRLEDPDAKEQTITK